MILNPSLLVPVAQLLASLFLGWLAVGVARAGGLAGLWWVVAWLGDLALLIAFPAVQVLRHRRRLRLEIEGRYFTFGPTFVYRVDIAGIRRYKD